MSENWYLTVNVVEPEEAWDDDLIDELEDLSSWNGDTWQSIHAQAQRIVARFDAGIEFYSVSLDPQPETVYLHSGNIRGHRVTVIVDCAPTFELNEEDME